MNEVRIDKWMWAVRIFKSRTIAVEACKKNRVMIGGVNVKASRMIKVGDVIQVRKPPITFSFKVLALTERRMGAKLVPDYMENVTTPDQYEILEMSRISGFVDRARGLGRPTKKDLPRTGTVHRSRAWPEMGLTSISISDRKVMMNDVLLLSKIELSWSPCQARGRDSSIIPNCASLPSTKHLHHSMSAKYRFSCHGYRTFQSA